MAANDAELLLKVGLDLGHFRGQLNRLGTELAGQGINVSVKFNRQVIASEFRLLDRYLRNKKFSVEINTNLKTEIERADKLVAAINRVQAAAGGAKGALPIGVAGLGLKKGPGNPSAADIKKLFNAAIQGGLLDKGTIARTRAEMVTALGTIARDSIAGLLNGWNSGDPKVRAAARSLGENFLAAFKDVLGIASPSKETGKLGKFAAEGFEKGFVSGMVKVERSMAIAIRSALMGAIRQGFGNLPGLAGALVGFERQLAAGVQLAVRKAMRDGMSAAVLPGAKGGALGGAGGAVTGAAVGGAKALGGGIAGGVAKLTAGGVMGTAANLVRYSMDSSAYQEFVGKLYQEIINSALSSGTQGAIIGALAVGGVAGGIGFARGATGSLIIQAVTAIRNRVLAALLAVSTGELNNVVKVMVRDVTGAIFQGAIRQLRAATAQLPAINWPAVTPPVGRASTATTMALPAGQQFAGLPGSAYGSQRRLIGDILDPSLKEILRGAANAFVDTVRQGMVNAVRSVVVRDLGAAMRPTLGAGRIAGLLSAGIGRMPSPYATAGAGGGLESRAEMFARREREARIRSALRGVDVMGGGGGRGAAPYSYAYRTARPLSAIVPYAPSGALVSGGGGAGGAGAVPPGGGGRGRGGGGMFGNIPNISLPGSGAIRELGEEFAFATKQVLLFGQAYKLLSFLQNFPAQVAQAVSQLQSFRNTLAAISPTAQEAAASNDLILQLVERYNIPLQSARDGFTKLYASMQPAGFSGDQIRDLFTGVSKAAATFGMSSDKIDRVNYAFAQMASKGQVMSEELKGQLGDVLPGAMAIFAQAAGFKGPEAISKFSAALEDGRYKGTAMMELLNNVSIVLNQKFSKGAEGAAKTFQGAINNMQTAMKSLYESFEPIAVSFLNGVVTPMMNGVKIVTDGLNAFFSGTQAQTAGGFALAQALERLRPSFEGIKKNAMDLVNVLGQFAKVALGVAQVLLQIAGNPVAGYLVKLYAIFLPLNIALNVMRGLWVSNAAQLLIFNARLVTGTSTLSAFRGMMAATGATAQTTSAAIRGAGLTLRTFFASTGIGLVLVGISLLIEKFMSMNQRLDETRAKALGAAQAIRAMSSTEARQAEFQAARDVRLLQQASQRRQVVPGRIAVSEAERAALERAGITTQLTATRERGPGGFKQTAELSSLAGAIQARQGIRREAEFQQTQLRFQEQQAAKPLQFAEIKGGGGDGPAKAKGGSKAANDAKRLAEEIARQAQAASDALFTEQQRLLVLQQTNPAAKAFAQYASQELTIQRELNQALKEAKSEKEKIDLRETSRIKQTANAVELEQEITRIREDALRPIEDTLKAQREQIQYDEDIKNLLATGMLPERAKQVAEVRKTVRAQLESLDLSLKNADAAITQAQALGLSAEEAEKLRKKLEEIREGSKGAIEEGGRRAEAGVPAEAAKTPMDYIREGAASAQEELSRLTNWGYQVVEGAKAIGSAFGQAFKDIISGSASAQEALANMMQSIADHFLDMAAQIIAQQITMMIYGIILKALGVMGGLGSMGSGGGFGSWSGPSSASAGGFGTGSMTLPGLEGAGALSPAGMYSGVKFADGGIVTGPTLGLVGEGKYNEAIVPLPDGRSIPVQLQDNSIRDKMEGNGAAGMSMPMLSMNFQSTTINGVEYVDRAQLEAAMAETRKIAVREGATRGASLVLDKLANSPSSRRRVGMR